MDALREAKSEVSQAKELAIPAQNAIIQGGGGGDFLAICSPRVQGCHQDFLDRGLSSSTKGLDYYLIEACIW